MASTSFSSPTDRAATAAEICGSPVGRSPDAPFELPANLGVGVNAVANEGAPTLSGDGLTLLFDRDDGGIWSASRSGATDPFGPATPVGPPVASPFGVGFPALAPGWSDALLRNAAAPRRGRPRHLAGDPGRRIRAFHDRRHPRRPVNLASADAMPGISADGLMLAFASRRERPGRLGSVAIGAGVCRWRLRVAHEPGAGPQHRGLRWSTGVRSRRIGSLLHVRPAGRRGRDRHLAGNDGLRLSGTDLGMSASGHEPGGAYTK